MMLVLRFCWWREIDQDIEIVAKTCQECQQNQNAHKGTPINAWKLPTKPWERVHIDYFLIVLRNLDFNSKRSKVSIMNNNTSLQTVERFERRVFLELVFQLKSSVIMGHIFLIAENFQTFRV